MVIIPHHSLKIVLYSKDPKNCGTWKGEGQMGCSSWTAEKTGASKMESALVLSAGQT